MPVFVYHNATTGRTTQLILPAGCEPCMDCNGIGSYVDSWGDERTCQECEGDGYIYTGDDRGSVTISVDETEDEDDQPANDPTMYDRPLF